MPRNKSNMLEVLNLAPIVYADYTVDAKRVITSSPVRFSALVNIFMECGLSRLQAECEQIRYRHLSVYTTGFQREFPKGVVQYE